MKKRIIASTMASVMALGAASSMVASADVADFKSQSATKSDLEKLMKDKEITDLVDGGIDNFGSISGENFQKAVDFANAVLEDIDSTADDYTTAYLMVKAAKNALKVRTKDELKLLVNQCKPIYDTNNELNEDDAKYTDDSWDKFVSAYDTAFDCQDSDDGLEVTDAYEELEKYQHPEELDTVTKLQVESARKAYIAALERQYDFQPWQRGTVSDTKTDYDGCQFAWGVLYAHIQSAKPDLMSAYEDFTEIKGRNVTSNKTIVEAVKAMNDAAKVLNAFTSKLDSASSKKNVTDLLTKYHGQLVYTYNSADAFDLAKSFATVVNGMTVSSVAGKAQFTDTEGKSKEVTAAAMTSEEAVKNKIWHAVQSGKKDYKPLGSNGTSDTATTGKEYTFSGTKTISAEMKLYSDREVWYIVETSRKLENNKNPIQVWNDSGTMTYFYDSKASADAKIASVEGYSSSKTYEAKSISAKSYFVISDLIEVNSADISANYANDMVANENDSSMDTDKAAVIAAITTTSTGLKATVDALAAKMAALKAEISALDAVADTDSTTTNKVTESTKATALAEVNEWDAAIASLKTKCATASNKLTKSIFDEIDGLVAGLDSTAGIVMGATQLDAADGTSKIAITAKVNTEAAAVDTAITAWNSAKDSYDTAYAGLQSANAAYGNYAKNEVYDYYDEADFKVKNSKTDKGLKFFYNGSNSSSFSTAIAYDSPLAEGSSVTTVSLDTAMAMYEAFVANPTDQTSAEALDNMNELPNDMETEKNYSKAWKILYNYMKYALADEFDAAASKTYKRSDVVSLKADAEKLIEQCVETELFSDSVNNTKTNVNAASDWLTMAKSDKSRYKDNDSKYDVNTVGTDGSVDSSDKDSTAMYNELNDTYKQLKKEYDAFKYGYGEIVTKISAIAKELDSNKFDAATTKKLADELNDTALKFVKVEAVKKDGGSEFDDSSLFNDDGTMNKSNRLFTNGSTFDSLWYDGQKVKIAESKKNETGKNYSHYEMQNAYEKLIKDYDEAVKALEEGNKLVQDVDGSGKLDVNDAVALMGIILNASDTSTATNKEIAKYDYDANGVVDVNDIVALVNAILAG